VADAFREVASAEVEARTLLEQARSARAALLPAALGEASSIRSQAEAEASALLARVRGEVEAFATIHEAFRASPDGFQERLLAETLAPLMPLWRGLYVVPSGAPAPRLLLPRPGGAP
jgi:regulator of protease activity HflC (stomatin/prohibitin superfamily)